MPRYQVRISRIAEADLAQIRGYLQTRQSSAFAARFVMQIMDHCDTFRTIPHRGTRLDWIRPGLRIVGWKRTVTIAFRVLDAQRQVQVVGVFYRGREMRTALRKRLED